MGWPAAAAAAIADLSRNGKKYVLLLNGGVLIIEHSTNTLRHQIEKEAFPFIFFFSLSLSLSSLYLSFSLSLSGSLLSSSHCLSLYTLISYCVCLSLSLSHILFIFRPSLLNSPLSQCQ